MFRPRQISQRFFVKRKVTPPDEDLRTIFSSPFVLDYTRLYKQNILSDYCLISQFTRGFHLGHLIDKKVVINYQQEC
jgi:hypothetical protein